jgi:mRNA-degrading endonuclease RelE of RelBE toxin-antitoxin system
MSYVVEFTDEAFDDLADLPASRWHVVQREIELVAQAPVARSRPAGFRLPRGQMHDFQYRIGSTTYHLAIVFRYAADEQTLSVIAIRQVTQP